MKLKTRLTALLLCLLLAASTLPVASAAQFYSGVADWFEPSLR